MLTNVDKKLAKTRQTRRCEPCNYTCCKKSDLIKHEATHKHKMLTNVDTMLTKSRQNSPHQIQCECGKVFRHRQSLSVHKKKCQPSLPHVEAEAVSTCEEQPSGDDRLSDDGAVFTQNNMAVMLEKMAEVISQTAVNTVKEMAQGGALNGNNSSHSHNTTNTNTNSHNKTFNLSFYLNETCKDAMNLQDFIKTLQLNTGDLERVGELGYTEGISRMFLKGLNDLDATKRPIHCSDLKREIIHIKDNDTWEQDNANRDKLRKAINDISNKNIMLLDDWQKENPGYDRYDSKKNDIYLKIMVESMGPDGNEASDKAFRKIIKRVATSTIICK